MLLKNQCVNEEIKKYLKKKTQKQTNKQQYLKTNDNENTIQNLWDATKAVLRGKFITIQAFLKKRRKISNQQFTLPPKGIKKTDYMEVKQLDIKKNRSMRKSKIPQDK